MSDTSAARTRLAYLIMFVAPLLFSSNMIFGRGVVGDVSPFTLALVRWVAVALALSPFMIAEQAAIRKVVASHWRPLLLMAFLGMWICGGGVYLALQWTTATNGTLIYTTSPVIILLLEAAFRGRRIGLREGLGAVVAFFGVCVIVLRGDPAALLSLSFNIGDVIFVVAAFAWAAYSIMNRTPSLQSLSNATMLGLLALVGSLLLLPVAVWEWTQGSRLPDTAQAWGSIAGIVVVSSLLAFTAFQFGIKQLGAPLAGVFMYLMPAYGVALALLFLGEELQPFHVAGIATVMGGVILATLPNRRKV